MSVKSIFNCQRIKVDSMYVHCTLCAQHTNHLVADGCSFVTTPFIHTLVLVCIDLFRDLFSGKCCREYHSTSKVAAQLYCEGETICSELNGFPCELCVFKRFVVFYSPVPVFPLFCKHFRMIIVKSLDECKQISLLIAIIIMDIL